MSFPVRSAALVAPLLLLTYGVLRLATDESRSPVRDVGQGFMLAALTCFGVLLVGLRRAVRAPSVRRATATTTMTVLGLVGVAVLLLLALDEAFPSADGAFPLPDRPNDVGPVLLLMGLSGLLVDVTIHEPHRMPAWSPVAVAAGFGAMALKPDLSTLAAMLLLAGLLPLVRTSALDRVRAPLE
ncbi:hypothetical protein [Aeromicrobium sp. NPDC092404]|uniref:hypothetical protein n=1 Tax=Aeromicrobium sp. NPDC092404 TaxID=3154976 RepID=UPI0034372F01